MWQRFTERGRKVVFYAQEEAQKFGEGYVATEHLLLGLVRDSDCVGARALEKLNVSLKRIRQEVEEQLPRGDQRHPQDMTLTPRAKRVIDLAFDEANQLGNNYIGTEHLLLGMIREGDGLAGRVLSRLGIRLDEARRAVVELQDPAQQQPGPDMPKWKKRAGPGPFRSGMDVGQRFRSVWQGLTGHRFHYEGQTRSEFDRREARGFTIWLRFSDRVRKVVMYAEEEAQAFGEGYLSTEHLLLGLLRERDSVAPRVLEKLEVNLARLRTELEAHLPRMSPGQDHDISLAPRTIRVFDLAYEHACELDKTAIGTGHLLLGLVGEGDGLAGKTLAKLGVDFGRTRVEVKALQDEE